jgi:hypothetical protein
MNTLRFALFARMIVHVVVRNEVLADSRLLAQYRLEVQTLREQLATTSSSVSLNEVSRVRLEMEAAETQHACALEEEARRVREQRRSLLMRSALLTLKENKARTCWEGAAESAR